MLFPKANILQKLIREVLFKESGEGHPKATVPLTVTLEVPSTILLVQEAFGITWRKWFSFAVLLANLAVRAVESE